MCGMCHAHAWAAGRLQAFHGAFKKIISICQQQQQQQYNIMVFKFDGAEAFKGASAPSLEREVSGKWLNKRFRWVMFISYCILSTLNNHFFASSICSHIQ